MSRRKITIIVLVSLIIIPILVTGLALQNPPWARSQFAHSVQSLISSLILSHFNVVTVPGNQTLYPVAKISPAKLRALRGGKIDILTVAEISDRNTRQRTTSNDRYVKWANPRNRFVEQTTTKDDRDRFVIAVIETLDLLGKTTVEKKRLIESVDDYALRGKIDVIVEATASDSARNNDWGLKSVEMLDRAGIIRCVVFDGGHHISSLPLNPDILLVPVTQHKKLLYASHWFTRDAVPVYKLEDLLRHEGLRCIIASFPRDGLPVKNPGGMAMIAGQTILNIAKSAAGKKMRNYNQNHGLVTLRENPRPDGNKLKYGPANSYLPRVNSPDNNREFISLRIDPKADKKEILKNLVAKKEAKGKRKDKVNRIYLGLTFGISEFPYRGETVKFDVAELERFLRKNLRCKVTVMSEPLSTWDIYLNRLGID